MPGQQLRGSATVKILSHKLWYAYISSFVLCLLLATNSQEPQSKEAYSMILFLQSVVAFISPGNPFFSSDSLVLNTSQQSNQGCCSIPSVRTRGLPLSWIFIPQLVTWAWCWISPETKMWLAILTSMAWLLLSATFYWVWASFPGHPLWLPLQATLPPQLAALPEQHFFASGTVTWRNRQCRDRYHIRSWPMPIWNPVIF